MKGENKVGKTNSKFVFIFLFLLLPLAGCLNNNLDLSQEVTSIEVYKWDSEELWSVIEDQGIIDKLVRELDSANTHSTENIDFPMPDYNLLFKKKETVLYEIGYYSEVVDLGIEGQYWEFDRIFGVKLELPID